MPANPRVSIDDIEVWLETDQDGNPVLAFPSLAAATGRLRVLSGEDAGTWDFGRVQGVQWDAEELASTMPEDLKALLLRAARYRIGRMAEMPELQILWSANPPGQTEGSDAR